MPDRGLRILMLTAKLDRRDWLFGFIHGWVDALARHPRVERVEVLCLERGEVDLPGNVRVQSMGKERGDGRLREFLTAQRAIAGTIRQVDVVFAHMMPRYALIAAPWAKLFGRPLVLWYTHREAGRELRWAHRLVDRVVTASPESFTLPSRKVTVIGHGIDMTRFRPGQRQPDAGGGRLIAAVGRLSPIKHYEALIDALAALVARPGFDDVRVEIAGGTTPEQPGYDATLHARAHQMGIEDRVALLGALPPDEVPALLARACVSANLCPTGGLDKAVIESMAGGTPVVVHNRTYLPLLGDDAALLWAETLDAGQIADRLAALLALSEDRRAALGTRLAARVREDYALEGLIDRLVGVFEEVAG